MNIVTPKIELIASTTLTNTGGGGPKIEDWMRLAPDATDAECLVEEAGRGCYESWDKPNPKTARNADYINRTAFEMQHGSILEHASATFRFSGVSRAWLCEMERHRHLSWSVVSQRYVDAAKFGVVIPPAIREEENFDGWRSAWETSVKDSFDRYEAFVKGLERSKCPSQTGAESCPPSPPECDRSSRRGHRQPARMAQPSSPYAHTPVPTAKSRNFPC